MSTKATITYYRLNNNVSPAKSAIDKLPPLYQVRIMQFFKFYSEDIASFEKSIQHISGAIHRFDILLYNTDRFSCYCFCDQFDGINPVVVVTGGYVITSNNSGKGKEVAALDRAQEYHQEHLSRKLDRFDSLICTDDHFGSLYQSKAFQRLWLERDHYYLSFKALSKFCHDNDTSIEEIAMRSGLQLKRMKGVMNGSLFLTLPTLTKIAQAFDKDLQIELVGKHHPDQ